MEINLELLLGKQVFALNNKPIGRIEEVRADLRGGDCYVEEYLIGTYAIFERLAALEIGRAVLGLFGSYVKTGYRVPWDELDLTDPKRPRIRCKINQLKRL